MPEFFATRFVGAVMKTPRRFTAVLLLSFLAFPVAASHADLRSLTHDLDTALAVSKLDAAGEAKVRAHLEDALRTVRAAGAVDIDCLDLVAPVYQKIYVATDAIRMAAALCRTGVDADVLRVTHDVLSKVYVPLDALRLAADYSRRDDLRGKGDVLRFANQQYATVYVPVDALRLAANFTATTPRGSAGCIERAFPIYRTSYHVHDALRFSGNLCRT